MNEKKNLFTFWTSSTDYVGNRKQGWLNFSFVQKEETTNHIFMIFNINYTGIYSLETYLSNGSSHSGGIVIYILPVRIFNMLLSDV